MVSRNDVGDESFRSQTLPKAVDEQHIECGIVLTQPSQETQVDTDVEETPLVASKETVLNVEPRCWSVGVGDATEFALDVDPPFVELEFMLEYEAMFEDERAEDSADDRPVLS
jgi:hypothetical protein